MIAPPQANPSPSLGRAAWVLCAGGMALIAAGCAGASEPRTGADSGSATTQGDTSTDAADAGRPAVCTGYFGQPTAKTGLDTTLCSPQCDCGGASFSFVPPSPATLAAWSATKFPAMATPTTDPYTADVPPTVAPGVCGVRKEPGGGHTLESAADADTLAKSGATLTHQGRCGLCSTLADLAVYARETDLTQPVRACGLEHFDDLAGNVACLRKIGFTAPCAWIWAYNTRNTRVRCLDVCLKALSAPYHLADGSLNPCLQCDEDKSGPVFKAVAGRTRRNSGLASALCRPCAQVHRIAHAYDL